MTEKTGCYNEDRQNRSLASGGELPDLISFQGHIGQSYPMRVQKKSKGGGMPMSAVGP